MTTPSRLVRPAAALLVATAAACLVIFVALPLGILLGRTLGLPETPSLDALAVALSSRNAAAIGNTIICSVGAALFALAWGAPLAFLVERTDVHGRRALGGLALVPLAVPPYLLAMAALALLSPRAGIVGRVLAEVGLELPIYGRPGIALVLGVAFSPLVVLKTRAALARMDASLEEAARTSGASPLRALVDHTLPLALPSVLASGALAFVGAAAAFGVPALLGSTAEPVVPVVTTRIATALQVGTAAATREALGLSCALAAVAALAFAAPALANKNVVVVTGKAPRPARLSLGRARAPVSAIVWSLGAVLVVAPLVALVVQAFTLRQGAPLSSDNVGVDHLRDVLLRSEVAPAAVRSLVLAAGASVLCVVLGTAVVVAGRRLKLRAMRGLGALTELAYAIPGTVLAVALVLTFSRDVRVVVLERATFTLALAGTTALLLVAYAVKYAALALRGADEALAQIHPSLEEAARTSGAAPARAFFDATLPLLKAHLLAAGLAIFLPTLTELTMSVLLVAPGTSTLGTVLFQLNDYGDPQEAAALAAWLVAAVLCGQAISSRIGRGADGAGGGGDGG